MKLSISRKIILIVAIGVAASSITILCISTILMSRLLTRTIYDDMSAMQSVILRTQLQEEERLLQETQLLTSMPQLVDAVYARDIEASREIAQMSRRRLGLDAITFTDASGIVIVRGHLDARGDNLSNRPAMRAALNGETTSGIFFEETALIPYAIRCYAPIFRNGVLVGALTMGTEIGVETYVDNLQQTSGMHFTLFKGGNILVTTIKDKDGNRASGSNFVDAKIMDSVFLNGETVIASGKIFGEPVMSAYWPIKNINGEIIGMWAITSSLIKQNRETNNVLIIVISCSLGIMLLLILVAGFFGRRIALPIRKATDYAVQVANGNLDVLFDVKSGDEVKLLVGALQTMVATLKERIKDADKQRVSAEEANKAKSTFLSTMSHEIRTPMNAILGITEIQLMNEMLDPDIRVSLEKIYASGDMLLSIINDILDLSKIEAGKLELLVDKYDIASLISDTAQLNMMRIGSKPIEFELFVDENVPANMLGDELRIKQIFNNLLSNAFKYTQAGMVNMTISTQTIENNEHELYLVANVSDTGQGMTKEQVSKLFDEYSRFNAEANRASEGTGLGMSITRNLIHLMNGDINVESEPGKGTTFIVRLLQGKSDTTVLGKEMAENLHQFRTRSRANMKRVQISRESMPYGKVLIVDDVETNIFVAKGLLAPYDLNIDSADSGFAAIKKIKDGEVYDIIFMDHMMPQMDGIEATKILRSMGYIHPIVALTANAVSGQASIFLENGFSDFISKPIDIRQMNVVLNKLIRDKQPPEVIESARQQAEAKKELSRNKQNQAIDPIFIEIFIRDAVKSLSVLGAVVKRITSLKKDSSCNVNDLRTFIIHTHGIKSALTYIGKMELAATALKLEQSGRDQKIDIIKAEAPAFISSLQALVKELSPSKNNVDDDAQDEDTEYLHESLLVIKSACKDYDEITANKAIVELREKTWSLQTKELLSLIAEHLLHSDFDEIIEAIDQFTKAG